MKKLLLAFIVAWTTLGLTQNVAAKQGFFFGIDVPYTEIQGDFKGDAGLTGQSEIIIFPKISGAFGIGVVAGYGVTPQAAFALSYEVSTHDGTWEGLKGDVNRSAVYADFKYSFLSSEATQPYLSAGIGRNTLVLKGGALNVSTGRSGDAQLDGYGFGVGAGFDHYVSDVVSLGFGFSYRKVSYNKASGVNESGGITNDVSGDEFSLRLGAAYHF